MKGSYQDVKTYVILHEGYRGRYLGLNNRAGGAALKRMAATVVESL